MPPVSIENKRPIIIRRSKKDGHHGHHGGAWKVAYADFVTAMMAFFMLLWLLANPDKQRLRGLAQYFSIAPENSVQVPTQDTAKGQSEGKDKKDTKSSSAPAGMAAGLRGGSTAVPAAALRVMAQELKVALQASSPDASAGIMVEESSQSLRVSLTDTEKKSMFLPGTATPTPFARLMLETVAKRLASSTARIAIEAHTDSLGNDSENWKLSAARAQSAREVLLQAGMASDRIAQLIALAGTRPVYPNEPNRPENRRVTIVVLAETSAMPSDSSFEF